MTKGALLIARNNETIDYVKQAIFLANRIKKYLNLPTSIITDSPDYLTELDTENVFDNVITIPYINDSHSKILRRLNFLSNSRV